LRGLRVGCKQELPRDQGPKAEKWTRLREAEIENAKILLILVKSVS
jgi:hypothetical protein